MVNSELSETSYIIQSGVTTYPIGFEYHFNENNSPQLLVKIGESVAIINEDFQLSADESEIILIPTEEEAKAQTSPSDTRWMDRIVDKKLLITRDIPFVQTSDYSVGRINPEQIEYDFDRAVMRDQMLEGEISHVQGELDLSNSRIDVVRAEHARDMAEVDIELSTKATKTELEIVKNTLNSHASELTTLSENQASLGDRVSGAEEKIPGDASATNQLATKADLASLNLAAYVKKSGDTMTGDLMFDEVAGGDTIVFQDSYKNVNTGSTDSVIKHISSHHQTQGLIFSETKNGTVDMQFSMSADGFFMPHGNRLLGGASYPWENIYAKKLNNGADIAVPTEGGTLARIEDVDGCVKKSGDTMTGFLTFEHPGFENPMKHVLHGGHGFSIEYYYNNEQYPRETWNFTGAGFFASTTTGVKPYLGISDYPWDNVYAKKLNNGADIAIPTDGGTLARIEDINTAVANKQDKLTAGENITIVDNVISAIDSSGITEVVHDDTLAGSGTTDSPLGLAETIKSEIAGKQKQLHPGTNVFINSTNPDYDIISVQNMVSSLNGLSGALSLQAGDGIVIDGLKISATGSGGASYTAGDGIDITNDTISVDSSVVKNNAVASNLENAIILGEGATGTHGGTAVGAQSHAGQYALALGKGADASGTSCVAIGPSAKAYSTRTYQIGPGTNSDSNTLQFLGYKLVDADGNVPLERLTYVTNQIGDISTALTAILGE